MGVSQFPHLSFPHSARQKSSLKSFWFTIFIPVISCCQMSNGCFGVPVSLYASSVGGTKTQKCKEQNVNVIKKRCFSPSTKGFGSAEYSYTSDLLNKTAQLFTLSPQNLIFLDRGASATSQLTLTVLWQKDECGHS